MSFDFRKILRYVVNVSALIVAVATLPELGALVPASVLPALAAVVAVINTVLSLVRQIGAGEPLVTKPF
jgi:hypothetical protein